MGKKLSYHTSVDYDTADPAKVLAQNEGLATAKNLPFGFKEVEGTRGESAYVFDMGDMYGAFVQEGLGTKSLIAQAIYEKTGTSHFAAIAQDTVATFINDLISVGATPVVSNAYWSSSSYKWLADHKLTEDFITGWRAACDAAGVTWGGGETQSLPGIVNDGVLEFAGSAFGVIKPKDQLVSDKKLSSGDAIVLIESSSVHANGISMIREIAATLPDGYQTKLADGSELGETVLTPTHLYARLVRELFAAGLDVHYLSNITGHGWRKIMRGRPAFSYVIDKVPPVAEVFNFIAKASGNSEAEMYSNYNMGAGYAVYLPSNEAQKAVEVAKKCGLKAWATGHLEAGPKQVMIIPYKITFKGETLKVR
ncbi:MAG TPA: AIR synthase-related protein [Patescibacteria group bacterium]|nr:AIR synthase-related protein [Patescibacteria group bacterium]